MIAELLLSIVIGMIIAAVITPKELGFTLDDWYNNTMSNTNDLKKTTQVHTIEGAPKPQVVPLSASQGSNNTTPAPLSITGDNLVVSYHPPKGNNLA